MLTNNRNHLNNTNEKKNTTIQLGVVDGIPKNKSRDTT